MEKRSPGENHAYAYGLIKNEATPSDADGAAKSMHF
jgi:hypothetical protein